MNAPIACARCEAAYVPAERTDDGLCAGCAREWERCANCGEPIPKGCNVEGCAACVDAEIEAEEALMERDYDDGSGSSECDR